ncbi:MAG: PilZ domain-containing protein [Candidatus Omnitrophica bacterium]|nr:PilZ domain-containing protein [Candidatus Omnitrophota bacterium]
MAERRRYKRFESSVGLEYCALTQNPIFGKALAKDLSREGVRFGIDQAVPPGTLVEIRMNVPGDNLPVFATGKIAWADGVEAGVQLTKMSRADRARMLEHVYHEWLGDQKKPVAAEEG